MAKVAHGDFPDHPPLLIGYLNPSAAPGAIAVLEELPRNHTCPVQGCSDVGLRFPLVIKQPCTVKYVKVEQLPRHGSGLG
jgi:hypothetical protein